MTTVIEPLLFDYTGTPIAKPVDTDTADLLDLIAGDPIHRDDRARVIDAIRQTAREHGGHVDPNRWRALLTNEHGSTVQPNVIGATVNALKRAGRLVEAGWVVTEGSRTGNSGKPARAYTWRNP